jgi:predicted RNase H-like HicB family nuclease
VKYSVLIQQGPTGYGASAPDLPGVFAVGKTFEETRDLIAGAIDFHLRGLVADGDPVPPPSSGMRLIEVSV